MDIRRISGPAPQQEPAINDQKEVGGKSSIESPQLIGLSSLDSLEVAAKPLIDIGALATPEEPQEMQLPNLGLMPFLTSDTTNPTGISGLAMILNYLGVNVSAEEISNAINRVKDTGTPQDILKFARSMDIKAEQYNNGTVEELKSFIDKGNPVLAMVSGKDGDEFLTITGYGTDQTKTPPEEYILYRDGVTGTDQRMSMAEFEEKWSDLGQGYNNYFIGFGGPDAILPGSRDEGIEASSAWNTGVSNFANGQDRLWNGDGAGERVHGFFQMFGGSVQCGLGGLGYYAFSGPAQWLNSKVEGIPVLENFVQPLGDLWDTAGAILGDVGNGIGGLLDNWGSGFGNLLEGNYKEFGLDMLEGVKDLGEGVVNAVADTITGIGDAIGDVFSGW